MSGSRSGRGFGKQKRQKPLLGYVLYQPKHNDFLSFVKETKDMYQVGWCQHPSGAKLFSNLSTVKDLAKDLAKDKPDGYQLKICKLVDTEDTYKVEEIDMFIKVSYAESPQVSK